MVVSPRVWFATFVALVFVIGVSGGVLIDRAWLLHEPGPGLRPGPGPGGPMRGGGRGDPLVGPPPERLVADLDAELHLTDSQRQQILAILDAHRPRVRALQDDARKQFLDEQKALQDEIAKTLTPDQAVRFLEMRRRQPELGPPPGRRGR